jgi:hypothetical protein
MPDDAPPEEKSGSTVLTFFKKSAQSQVARLRAVTLSVHELLAPSTSYRPLRRRGITLRSELMTMDTRLWEVDLTVKRSTLAELGLHQLGWPALAILELRAVADHADAATRKTWFKFATRPSGTDDAPFKTLMDEAVKECNLQEQLRCTWCVRTELAAGNDGSATGPPALVATTRLAVGLQADELERLKKLCECVTEKLRAQGRSGDVHSPWTLGDVKYDVLRLRAGNVDMYKCDDHTPSRLPPSRHPPSRPPPSRPPAVTAPAVTSPHRHGTRRHEPPPDLLRLI